MLYTYCAVRPCKTTYKTYILISSCSRGNGRFFFFFSGFRTGRTTSGLGRPPRKGSSELLSSEPNLKTAISMRRPFLDATHATGRAELAGTGADGGAEQVVAGCEFGTRLGVFFLFFSSSV